MPRPYDSTDVVVPAYLSGKQPRGVLKKTNPNQPDWMTRIAPTKPSLNVSNPIPMDDPNDVAYRIQRKNTGQGHARRPSAQDVQDRLRQLGPANLSPVTVQRSATTVQHRGRSGITSNNLTPLGYNFNIGPPPPRPVRPAGLDLNTTPALGTSSSSSDDDPSPLTPSPQPDEPYFGRRKKSQDDAEAFLRALASPRSPARSASMARSPTRPPLVSRPPNLNLSVAQPRSPTESSFGATPRSPPASMSAFSTRAVRPAVFANLETASSAPGGLSLLSTDGLQGMPREDPFSEKMLARREKERDVERERRRAEKRESEMTERAMQERQSLSAAEITRERRSVRASQPAPRPSAPVPLRARELSPPPVMAPLPSRPEFSPRRPMMELQAPQPLRIRSPPRSPTAPTFAAPQARKPSEGLSADALFQSIESLVPMKTRSPPPRPQLSMPPVSSRRISRSYPSSPKDLNHIDFLSPYMQPPSRPGSVAFSDASAASSAMTAGGTRFNIKNKALRVTNGANSSTGSSSRSSISSAISSLFQPAPIKITPRVDLLRTDTTKRQPMTRSQSSPLSPTLVSSPLLPSPSIAAPPVISYQTTENLQPDVMLALSALRSGYDDDEFDLERHLARKGDDEFDAVMSLNVLMKVMGYARSTRDRRVPTSYRR